MTCRMPWTEFLTCCWNARRRQYQPPRSGPLPELRTSPSHVLSLNVYSCELGGYILRGYANTEVLRRSKSLNYQRSKLPNCSGLTMAM
jgi:hypothetical protein